MKMDQKGQAITEAVLILVMLFAFTFSVASFFKNEEILKKIVTGPFTYLAGMLQNGVWLPPEKGAASHPNRHFRHISVIGDSPQ